MTDPAQLRLGFAGTPEFAAQILRGLIDAGCPPVQVWSQPDRPSGRGRKTRPSPVSALAMEQCIALHKPASLRNSAEVAALASLQLDALIVAAYGLILPPPILSTPRFGCINVHASLLPRWRGAAPIERALMAGDTETGVSIMQMDAGVDTGPVFLRRATPITPDDTGDSLHERLATLGSEALLAVLPELGHLQAEPQPDTGITHAAKLSAEDSRLDFNRPAETLALQIRALNSRQPALAWLGNERIRLLFAVATPDTSVSSGSAHRPEPGTIVAADRDGLLVCTGTGLLRVTRLQLSRGKGRPLSVAEALNGYGDLLKAGQRLQPVPAP